MGTDYIDKNQAAGNANSLTPTLPTGWEAGNLCLLIGFAYKQVTWSLPAGWTSLLTTSSSTYGSLAVAYRILEPGDSNPTLSYSESADSFAALTMSVSEPHASAPVVSTAEEFTISGSPYTATLASITTVHDNALVFIVYGLKNDASSTPTGLIERADFGTALGSDCMLAASSKIFATAGATGSFTITYASGADTFSGTAAKIAIRPMRSNRHYPPRPWGQ